MFLFFLPPAVQVAIGVVLLVVGLALHFVIVAVGAALGIAFGATRYFRSRRANGFQR